MENISLLRWFLENQLKTSTGELDNWYISKMLSRIWLWNGTDLLWVNSVLRLPIELHFLRKNTQQQIDLIVDRLSSLLMVGYADGMNLSPDISEMSLYQNGEWTEEFLKCLALRTGNYFVYKHGLGESWLLEKMLVFIKQHWPLLVRKNVILIYENNSLYMRKIPNSTIN